MRKKKTFSVKLIRNVNDDYCYDVVFEGDHLVGRLHRDECEELGIPIYDYAKASYLDAITFDVMAEETSRECKRRK